jgi:hypothetical protein
MAKRKRTTRRTMVLKTRHRSLKREREREREINANTTKLGDELRCSGNDSCSSATDGTYRVAENKIINDLHCLRFDPYIIVGLNHYVKDDGKYMGIRVTDV